MVQLALGGDLITSPETRGLEYVSPSPPRVVEGDKRGRSGGSRDPPLCIFFPANRQGVEGEGRRSLPRTLVLGSLNVRGCSTDEDKREVIGRMFERRRMDVLALSETKLRGKGEIEFGSVSGRKSGVVRGRAREGVALLVSPEVQRGVIEWRELSPRLMWVKVKFRQEVWVFISAYAPGSEKVEEEREAFWKDVDDCVQSFGANVKVVLMGDLNARVGDEEIEGVVGRYGVPGRNENGDRLIGVCVEREMVVGNTLFKKKDIHKYTWVRQEGGRVVDKAMMDYVAVPRKVAGCEGFQRGE